MADHTALDAIHDAMQDLDKKNVKTFTVRSKLIVWHTDEVQANSETAARAIVDEWMAEDFTEDSESSRSWEITIV